MEEHQAPYKKELRRRATSMRVSKAEVLFVITFVAFIVYGLFMSATTFEQALKESWRWTSMRMLFVMIGAVIGVFAVISLALSTWKLAKIIRKKIHASPYPPLLFIILNVGVIVAIALIMRQKLNVEL